MSGNNDDVHPFQQYFITLKDRTVQSITPFICKRHQREHYRNFNQHAHHSNQRCRRLKPEQCDGNGHSQLKKVTCANHGCRSTDAILQLHPSAAKPGKEKYKIGLNDQRNGNKQDDKRIVENVLPLEGKQQNQRDQQRQNTYGLT